MTKLKKGSNRKGKRAEQGMQDNKEDNSARRGIRRTQETPESTENITTLHGRQHNMGSKTVKQDLSEEGNNRTGRKKT